MYAFGYNMVAVGDRFFNYSVTFEGSSFRRTTNTTDAAATITTSTIGVFLTWNYDQSGKISVKCSNSMVS